MHIEASSARLSSIQSAISKTILRSAMNQDAQMVDKLLGELEEMQAQQAAKQVEALMHPNATAVDMQV